MTQTFLQFPLMTKDVSHKTYFLNRYYKIYLLQWLKSFPIKTCASYLSQNVCNNIMITDNYNANERCDKKCFTKLIDNQKWPILV